MTTNKPSTRETTISVHPNPLRSIEIQARGQITSTQLDNHILWIFPRHMRALVNDGLEGLPLRLNTSRSIGNECIIYQPDLLEPLPTRLEKRKSDNIDVLTFIFSEHDTLFP